MGQLQHLFSFWYLMSPQWVFRRFSRTIQTFEGHLAVKDTLRNLNKPLFQDYTLQGRIIGVMLRLARVTVAVFIYGLIFFVYAFAYLLWLLFPIICLVSLVGAFAGPVPGSQGAQ